MEYRLYHDESKQAGYWHGILLVPEKSRKRLIELLLRVRINTGYEGVIGLKHVKKETGKIYRCAESWILLAIGLMRTKLGNDNYPLHYGETKNGKLVLCHTLSEILGLKFVLFREKDNHNKMTLLDNYASKVETTFRIGLKGGLHFLSSNEKPIHITGMHFDGYEHHGGVVNKQRIIDQLYGLKDSCSVLRASNSIDSRSSKHTQKGCQEYDDCQFLQLTDLLVGGFRTLLGECTRKIHTKLCHSLHQPIEAFFRRPAGFRNSRWCGSLCMSQCELINGQWKYSTLELIKRKNTQQYIDFTE